LSVEIDHAPHGATAEKAGCPDPRSGPLCGGLKRGRGPRLQARLEQPGADVAGCFLVKLDSTTTDGNSQALNDIKSPIMHKRRWPTRLEENNDLDAFHSATFCDGR